jgi:hypothetical protein
LFPHFVSKEHAPFMSPRSIRRAAEHKARKLARKETPQRITEPVTDDQVTPELPDRKDTRGQATGPKTPEGKAISCMNALKTGLTGRTVLLPTDDAAAFEQHIQAYFDEYKPQGLRERELVQSLAETRWRLNRSFALEAALFSPAAAKTEEGAPAPSNVDNLLKHEKTLKNLHLQEARLHRRFDKDVAELRALQAERVQAKDSHVEEKAQFEFSTDDIDPFLEDLDIPSGAAPRAAAASQAAPGSVPTEFIATSVRAAE